MPIRTNRGRAAVYRRLWGAPLRSPKHLIVTIVLVVAVLTGIGFLVPQLVPGIDKLSGGSGAALTTPSTAPPPIAEQPPVSAGETPTETRLTKQPLTPTSAPAAPQALTVARKWSQAWVNHPKGISAKEWLAGLEPYTTEEYLAVMKSVDPGNVPADEVTGAPKVVNSFTSSVDIDVPTDGPTLRLTVVATDDGWRVANYAEAG